MSSIQTQEEIKEKKNKKKHYTFSLKNVDISKIDNKYGISIAQNLQSIETPKNATSIDNLQISAKHNNYIPFIDKSKKHYVSMIDSISKQKLQCSCCFWCRHSFEHVPIGCPIRYVNSYAVQHHVSEITKEKYSIVHKMPKNVLLNNSNTSQVTNDYYETDGCFCSFNCCMAFIQDNTHNSLYVNSKYLLMKMYAEIFSQTKLSKIQPAPSWKLLKVYGGFMGITEFRNSFGHYIYIDNQYRISSLPKTIPIGHVFEEHIIF